MSRKQRKLHSDCAPLSPSTFEGLEPRLLLSTAGPTLPHGFSSLRWQGHDTIVRTAHWILKTDSAKGSPTDQLKSMQQAVHRANKNLNVRQYLGEDGLVLITSGTRAKFQNLVSSLKSLRGFKYLEPNFIIKAATLPNDSFFPNQDDLDNTGQGGGTPDADIDAPEAWDLTTGSSDLVIGVIDSGIDYNHPDLAANIWTNPFEIAGDGLDNDANGYIDDIHGWDFANDDNDPMDDLGHGTHVSGTIAAVGNNFTDVSGISWSSKLMALKILGADGSGELSAAIAALNYADDMAVRGVNIRATNNSYGDPGFSLAMEDTIRASAEAGLLFIAAAGNSGTDNDIVPFYPASSEGDNIISVAATDHSDQKAGFSNYGATSVHIGAPGNGTWSTARGGGVTIMSGTSMATPHVTGVAALAFSISPRGTDYSVIRNAILNGGDAIPSLAGITTTGRRLNAYGALAQLPLTVIHATPATDEVVSTTVQDYQLKFSHPINPQSVDAADLQVNGLFANSVTINNPTIITFHYNNSPLTNQGIQSIHLIDGSITRQIDGAIAQRFNEVFRHDGLPMQVLSATIQRQQSLVQVDLNLNEPIDPASLNLADLQVDQGTLTAAQAITPLHLRFTISGLDPEVTLHASLPAGALTDPFGNPSLAYSTTLELDNVAPTDLPNPLPHLSPLGSLIRGAGAVGLINNPTDTDTFTLPLLAGQRVSLAVMGTGGLQPTFTLLSPDNQPVAIANPNSNIAAIRDFPIDSSGTYSVVVASSNSTAGNYTLRASVNATLEAELLSGPTNNTRLAAQPLDFDSLMNGASRAAVAGQTDLPLDVLSTEVEPNDSTANANPGSKNFLPAPSNLFQMGIKGALGSSDVDFFALGEFQSGDTISIALGGAGGPRGSLSDPFLELYRSTSDGPLLVTDDDDSGPGIDALINRYVITDAGSYYVKVRPYSTQTGSYDLAMFLENVDASPLTGGPQRSDSEPNNSLETAVNTASSWRAVQYLSTTAGSITSGDHDMVSYSLHQGDLVTVEVDPAATLRPRLTLRDQFGSPLAADDGTSRTPDHSAIIYTYIIPTTNTYYIDTFAKSGGGSYTSNLYLTSNFTPTAPTPAPDLYSFNLDAAQQASLIVQNSSAGALSLELQNSAGATIATSAATSTPGQQVIASFTAPTAGTYYARISGERFGDYTLLVTRDSAFDLGDNDSTATAQSIATAANVLGYIDGDDDWYSLPISMGNTVRISAAPLGASDNLLQPSLELYDPSGALVSSQDVITAQAPTKGTYRIHLSGVGSGEYLLSLTRFWSLPGTSGDDEVYIRQNTVSQDVEIFLNTSLAQAPTYSIAPDLLGGVGIDGRGGVDHFIIDGAAVVLAQPSLTSSLDLTLRNTAQVSFQGSPTLTRLNLEDDSRAALTAGHNLLRLGQIEISPDARLDLQDGSLILQADEASRTAMLNLLTQRIRLARGNGDWSGPGILTSAVDSNRINTLGIMLNGSGGSDLKLTFAGQAVDANSILLGYALIGDTNLDGHIDGDDYARIDASIASHVENPTYADGDFDYSGSINADDFFYIDRAFASQ